MSVTVVKQRAAGGIHSVSLSVEQSGMDVSVKSGQFRVSGVDYEFTEDQDFSAEAAAECDTIVTGYIAKDVSTGVLVLIVDEEVLDGEDVPFIFSGSGYDPIHRLFSLKVPAAATSLDGVDVTVYHIVEPEKQDQTVQPGSSREPLKTEEQE